MLCTPRLRFPREIVRHLSIKDGRRGLPIRLEVRFPGLLAKVRENPEAVYGAFMPKSFIFIVLASCTLAGNSYCQHVSKYQPATLIRVHETLLASTYIEDTGIGAPELPEFYNYDIAVQLSCDVYTGRYRSDNEHLSSALGLDHAIEARVQKKTLYVKTDQDRVLEMRLVGHRLAKGDGCPTKLAVSTSP